KNGSITIKKVMVNGTGTFTFTGTPGGTISVNNGTVGGTLPPATYTSAETVPTGWVLTNIDCTGKINSTITIGANDGFDQGDNNVTIVLAAGENIVCTFTNTKPTISTTASIASNKLNDSITLGGINSGTLTMKLFGPNDGTCSG